MKTNKYHKWYDQLIDRARNRTIEGYVERHHIVPRSLGGTDEPSNIVKLTAREHLIAHMLLVRFVENKAPMWNALWIMMNANKSRVVYNSRLYEQAKIECAQLMSSLNKGKIVSSETRAKISAAFKGKKKSPEHIAKSQATQAANRAANAAKGIYRKISPEHVAKTLAIRAANYAIKVAEGNPRKLSPETIAKRTATQAANRAAKVAQGISFKYSPERVAKMRITHSGIKQSPETIAKRNATRAATRALKLSRLNQLSESSDVGIREPGVSL